jgi:hypothetical protein
MVLPADEISHGYGGVLRRRSVTKNSACIGRSAHVVFMDGTVIWFGTGNTPPPSCWADISSEGVGLGGVRRTCEGCVICSVTTTTASTIGWGIWGMVIGVRGAAPDGVYMAQLLRVRR